MTLPLQAIGLFLLLRGLEVYETFITTASKLLTPFVDLSLCMLYKIGKCCFYSSPAARQLNAKR